MPATIRNSEYTMTLAWYEEVVAVVWSDRPEFNEPFHWRREAVEDIYHQFRAKGHPHQMALSDTIIALPDLEMKVDGQVVYKQKSRQRA
ncbi:hypothetical protein [Spirosoma fluviale]|uniref:Uncharacterized protein n=1 Tax=Spirosoma fluviale TaxID=1597977 RepID=A0A286FDC7_9BACT|nr:hypothetical protein [Spirosoma fluviale]SOD81106.1 hypothetical protein SAMN06269250_1676 [Spirosoma fluviale]